MVLRIAIDVREACSSRPTGKGVWAAGFLRELATRPGVTLIGIADREVELPAGVRLHCIPSTGLRWHWKVARWLRTSGAADIYVSPTSYIVPALLGRSFPHIPIVHDLIAFKREPHNRRATFIERLTLKRAAWTAAHVCTVSETTRIDLCTRIRDFDSKRVTPIFAGPQTSHPSPRASDGRTILCVATLCPRKNQLRLIQAYAALPSSLRAQYRLVLAGGRGWDDESIIELARTTDGVEWRGYIDAIEYDRLLSTCAIFAFPSLYEGFGLPVLDAFQRGVPVLTSASGSLAEISRDASLIVNPFSVVTLTEGLNYILSSAELRDQLAENARRQAALYTWERTVDLFLKVVQKM